MKSLKPILYGEPAPESLCHTGVQVVTVARESKCDCASSSQDRSQWVYKSSYVSAVLMDDSLNPQLDRTIALTVPPISAAKELAMMGHLPPPPRFLRAE